MVAIGSYTLWEWRLSPHPSSKVQDRTFIFRQCKANFSRCLSFICRSGVAAGGFVEAVTQEDGCEARPGCMCSSAASPGSPGASG